MSENEVALTPDEQAAVQNALTMFQEYNGAPGVPEAITARALYHYALELMSGATSAERSVQVRVLATAKVSMAKAYAIFPLPIFLYDLAGLESIAANHAKATDLYRAFLSTQSTFSPSPSATAILRERDLDAC